MLPTPGYVVVMATKCHTYGTTKQCMCTAEVGGLGFDSQWLPMHFFLQFVSILIYHQLLTSSSYCQLLLISIVTKIIMSTVGCVVCMLEHLHSAISLAYPCMHTPVPSSIVSSHTNL